MCEHVHERQHCDKYAEVIKQYFKLKLISQRKRTYKQSNTFMYI